MRAIIVVSFMLVCAGSARADTIKITDPPYSADRTGAVDSAAAFRLAITALDAGGGGTLYVPTGTYLFATNSPGGAFNVDIYSAGIHVLGDSDITDGQAGSVVYQTTTGDAFYLRDRSSGGGTYFPPDNTIFENLFIQHGGSGASAGAGIRYATNNATGFGRMAGCVVRNISVSRFAKGVSTADTARGVVSRARLASFTMESCHIHDNLGDGLYVEEFSDIKIIGSDFYLNGGHGVNLTTFVTSAGVPYTGSSAVGSAFIQSCSMKYNQKAGLNCRGEQTQFPGNQIKDVHVSCCQMTGNGQQGFNVTEAANVEVATCTISENLGLSANNVGHCAGVSIIGCTFKANAAKALQVAGGSSGVAVASCAFVGNSASFPGVYYALNIVTGASNQSYSNLTFSGSASGGPQTRGVLLSGNSTAPYDPTGILMQGLNFEAGMVAVLAEDSLSGAQKYRMDFLSPQNWTTATPPSTLNGVMQYIQH